LFTKKSAPVISELKPEILKSKESLIKDKKSSRNIFSESDSDDEYMDSKLKIKEAASYSIIDNNTTTFLDFSSDDDLFSTKSVNKTIPKQKSILSSSPIHVEVLNKSNEIIHVSKPPIEEYKLKGTLNKDVIDELKNHTINSNLADKKVAKKESLQNNNTLNSNNMESPNNDNIMIQSNQKFSNSQQTKRLSNFFSLDEDDFDDDKLFNINEPNKNSIKKYQPISNASQNINHELHGSKVNLFDSSSDDDIFVTDNPNSILKFSKIRKQSSSNEVKNICISKDVDDCAVMNEIQNIDKNNQPGNDILEKKNTNIFTLLSDDDEDDNYFSFDKNISDTSMNVSNNQIINEKISISLSSEEFLSPQMDQKNQDMFQNTPVDSLQNSKNDQSSSQKETHIPNNEIISNENTIPGNKSSIFSSNGDKQQLIFSPQIQNENSNKETKMISPTLNRLPANLLNTKNQESFKKEYINTLNTTTLPISTENTIQNIKSSIFSSSNDGQQFSFNSNIQNENTIEEIKVVLKDSIDGPSFSSPNSTNETTKKLPGKANIY